MALQTSIQDIPSIRAAINKEVAERGEAVKGLSERLSLASEQLQANLLGRCEALNASLREDIMGAVGIQFEAAAVKQENDEAARLKMMTILDQDLKNLISERSAGHEQAAAAAELRLKEHFGTALHQERERHQEHVAETCGDIEKSMRALHVEKDTSSQAHRDALKAQLLQMQDHLGGQLEGLHDSHAALTQHGGTGTHMEELERWKAAHAEGSQGWLSQQLEQLILDMSAKSDAALQSHKQAAKESTNATWTHFQDVRDEVKRLDRVTAEFTCAHLKARSDDRTHFETLVHSSAQEVRSALAAQVEFAEALEQEQHLAMERFGQSLANESAEHAALEKRVELNECDMSKVRVHLPILFASPSSFR